MESGEYPDESSVPEQDAAPELEPGTAHAPADAALPALPPLPSGELRVWAMLAHLLAIGGYMTGLGLLGWVGPLVIWIKKRHADPFVAFHALQSIFFQLIWTGLLFVGVRFIWLMPEIFLGWIVLSTVPVIWAVVAALKAHQGEWYQYPLVGQWALDLTEQCSPEP